LAVVTASRRIPFLAVIVVALALSALPGSAATPRPGTLDATFGRGGKVTTHLAQEGSVALITLLVQPDGKIVAGGSAALESGDAGVVLRYRANGSLDPSFGRRGIVYVHRAGEQGAVVDLATQADGRIVGVGSVDVVTDDPDSDTRRVLLFRLRRDGSLDPSFGSGGRVVTDLPTAVDVGVAIAVDARGRLVVGAQGGDPLRENRRFFILRYSANGLPDPTFQVTETAFPERPTSLLQDLALDRAGRIVAVGYAENLDVAAPPPTLAVAARYLPDGGLDPSFGIGGRAVVAPTTLVSVLVQPDGKIAVSGGDSTFEVLRLMPDGSRDSTFGRDGDVRTGGNFVFASALVYRRGKLVAGGWNWPKRPGPQHFALARYDARGRLDPTFGRGGKVTTTFSRDGEVIRALAVDGRGRIVAGGEGFSAGRFVFELARYRG
jgi:uncharacterized delta-60 repeat protein